MRLDVAPDPQTVAQRLAQWIAARVSASEDIFRLALSGGNTPRLLYAELASPEYREEIEWQRMAFFWGDERFVPASDPRSNYRMARETLLSHVPVLIEHVHPIPTDGDLLSAAQHYDGLLKKVYGADVLNPERTLFNLVLLGLGEDGHTASLFPAGAALEERTRWVAAVKGGREEPRITLTYPTLHSSDAVAFMVTGEGKADIVRRVLGGDESLPATRVSSEGEVAWFLDRAAASCLDHRDGG